MTHDDVTSEATTVTATRDTLAPPGPAPRPAPAGRADGGVWPQAVLDTLAVDPARAVVEDGDRVVRAGETLDAVARVATALRAAGVGPGVGVGLELGVGPEALAGTLGAFTVGARVCGVPPGLTDAARRDLLDRADVAVVVDDDAVRRMLASPADGPAVAQGRPGDVARVTWTSGSSGRPKGCVQTYASMTGAWAPYPDRWPPAVAALAPRLARYLVVGPLSSQVVLEYAVLTLAAGGVLVPARTRDMPEALVRHRATACVLTVGRLHGLVRARRERPVDLSALRALLVSGSPLAPARLAEALDVLGPVVFHGYGQTETGMIAMLGPDEMALSRSLHDTVGRPPAAVDVEVRAGELWVRTPSQASGYWDDPQEEDGVFVDGWVRTRDLGSLDAAGYLRLHGRTRDVVIVDAQLVHAGPVERVLAEDPAVAEAYVVARPDDVSGEAVHAVVVPAAGAVPDVAALRARVVERLGPAAEPRSVTFVDAVPLAPSGKPDKSALAAATPSA